MNTQFPKTHGMTRVGGHKGPINPTYLSWQRMKGRCLNPKDQDYRHYGGRGITVCERWMKFENFLADMGERPAGLQIDRYPNNDGNYEPSNCRWATKKQNARTRRRCVMITVSGVTRSATEWDEVTGLGRDTCSQRIKAGWDPVKAAITPLDMRYATPKPRRL
jgi:hypothetical protein